MITQENIAKKLNISRATVSRALNGGCILDSKREAILKTAEEMGYVKNNAATSLASKKTIIVQAFLITSVVDGYHQQIKKGILDACEMRSGYQFEVKMHYTDINKSKDLESYQLEYFFDTMLNNKGDAVIASPISEKNMTLMLEHCKELNVPFFTLDMPFKNKSICHVGADYNQIGNITAALIANLINKNGNVLLISYDEGYELNNSRIKGFEEKMKSYPNINVRKETINNISYESYYNIIDSIYNKYDLSAIYATFRTEYVANVLKQLNPIKAPILVANDLNKEIYKYLQDDIINAIIYQRPYDQGYLITELCFKYFFQKDKYKKSEFNTGSDILIKENINIINHPY